MRKLWLQAGRKLLPLFFLNLSACLNYGAFDLAPDYKPDEFVVPDSWHGSGVFVEATPSDSVLRKEWWQLFDDAVLTALEVEVLAVNPDLQAAAERFVQARDEMMKARSRFLPKLGLGVDASDNRQSSERLWRAAGSPLRESDLSVGAFAAWEPDFWSRLRNATRVEIYHAEERAADFALARLSLQAELASYYFTLRGLDAQDSIYRQSIDYYQRSLDLVQIKFKGLLAGELDVARSQYILSKTKARRLGIQAQRQVVEHAIAILLNRVPASFSITPVNTFEVVKLQIPKVMPSTLVQRRPDIAGMERKMAQANREIGIARAAFFPNIPIGGGVGTSGPFARLFSLPNLFWSIGAALDLPAFEGGFRRAQLQKMWSAYRETQDLYRSSVLNAFREVEDGLTLTNLVAQQVEQQTEATAAAVKQQDLSMTLYKGSLASSLDLIYSQLNALEARITLAEVKADLLRSMVGLIRSLGGGWSREELPKDDDIQPFNVFQYTGLDKPKEEGGIDVEVEHREGMKDLTVPRKEKD